MDTWDQLLADDAGATGPTIEQVQALFQETFEMDALPGEQEGSIIYLKGRVAGRNIKINGINVVRTGPLGLPLAERKRLLRAAVTRVPVSPEPVTEPEPVPA
jgi:hypothetical protein